MVKASIIKLVDCVRESEGKVELIHTDQLAAKGLQQRQTNIDGEFRTYHLGVVNLMEDEEELESEQTVLNDHHHLPATTVHEKY